MVHGQSATSAVGFLIVSLAASSPCLRSSIRTAEWRPALRRNNAHQGQIVATSMFDSVGKLLESHQPSRFQKPS